MVDGLNWRIYYGDGSTFDSGAGAPRDAPARDVQCIVQRDSGVGRVVLWRWDWFYFWAGHGWWGSDLHGLLDLLTDRGGPSRIDGDTVLMGRMSPQFEKIFGRATNDPDFPPKSGGIRRERGNSGAV